MNQLLKKEITMRKQLLLILILLIIPITASCRRPPLPPPVVLFDQGHKQHFLIENNDPLDLSKLADIFKKQGFTVKSSSTRFTANLLHNVSTLIISGPFLEVNPNEILVIQNFLSNGGQMAIMLHIGSPVEKLLNSLGVAVSSGVVHEQKNIITATKDTDFYVTNLAKHPLTKGLKQVNLYGAWALNTQLKANIIAQTSPLAWVDLNNNQKLERGDAVQAFSEIVTGQLGHGHFIVFADDAIFQNTFLNGQNEILGINLAKWLKQGSYYPHE